MKIKNNNLKDHVKYLEDMVLSDKTFIKSPLCETIYHKGKYYNILK